MKREIAKANYATNWDREFTTLEALLERIKVLSENGAYRCQVYIDSVTAYDYTKGELSALGYDVEDYNGGGNGILEIDWG